MRSHGIITATTLAVAIIVGQALSASVAEAQCTTSGPTCVQVGADAKGALGGGILGAEIGFIVPALIVSAGVRELDEPWAWIIFPAVGAAGGAIGGYYALEDPTTTDDMGVERRGFPEAAVAVLVISVALIVPTFVGVLALTSYSPGASDEGSGATGDEDARDGASAPESDGADDEASDEPQASALSRVLAGGPGLLRFDDGRMLLGVPMLHSVDSYTAEERAHMQLPQAADLRIPLVSGTF